MNRNVIIASFIVCVITLACVQAREIEEGKPLPSDLTEEELNSIPWLNQKAKAKLGRVLRGETTQNGVKFPKARDLYWKRLRTDPELGYIPSHKYVEALEQIETMSKDKRDSTSSWFNLGPSLNKGGRTRSLIIFNSTHFLAGSVSGGIWRTTDGGSSWSPINDLFPYLAISTMAAAGNIVYAGTGEGFNNADGVRGLGIYKSTDYGLTWNLLSSTTINDFAYVCKVAILSGTSGNTVYAGTWEGIYKSTDGGDTFIPLAVGSKIYDVALNTGTNVLIWAESLGVYISTDSGASFNPIDGVSSQPSLGYWRGSCAYAPTDDSIAYCTHADYFGVSRGIYKSTDGGVTFSNVLNGGVSLNNQLFDRANFICNGDFSESVGYYANAIAVDPLDATKVYVGGVDIWR